MIEQFFPCFFLQYYWDLDSIKCLFSFSVFSTSFHWSNILFWSKNGCQTPFGLFYFCFIKDDLIILQLFYALYIFASWFQGKWLLGFTAIKNEFIFMLFYVFMHLLYIMQTRCNGTKEESIHWMLPTIYDVWLQDLDS